MNTRYSLKELSGTSIRMINGGEYMLFDSPTTRFRGIVDVFNKYGAN